MMTLLRRNPGTTTMLVVFWIMGASTGFGPSDDLLDRVGLGGEQLARGHSWNLVTSVFFASDLSHYIGVTITLALLCGLAERKLGTGHMVLVFFVTHVLGAIITVGTVTLGTAVGDWWSTDLISTVVVSPTGGAFGAALAASVRLPALWRRRLRLTLVLSMVMLALYAGSLVDLVRLFAGVTGLALGPLMLGRSKRPPDTAPSRVESRLLVAMIVAVSAIGPLVATASQTASGPLKVLQLLLAGEHPDPSDVDGICADPTMALDCQRARVALRLAGIGPAFLSIIPALLMLVMAEGLRRGRRFAWWGAVGLNGALTALGVVQLISYINDRVSMSSQDWTETGASLLQPSLVLGLLLFTKRRFDVLAPAGVYRKLAVTTAVTFVFCALTYAVGGYMVRGQFEHPPSFGLLLSDLPTRFAPPGYLGAFDLTVVPTGFMAMLLYKWIGVVFWAVVIACCVLTFLRARVESLMADRIRARALLAEFGGTSMSHMITWRGNNYWFTPDGRAVIAYRVISAVALTTGEPVGAPEARLEAPGQFARFCATNGWTPCFYGVSEQLRAELTTATWNSVQVAEETVLPLPDLQFRGKKWQDVRTALNKAASLGVTAQAVRFPDAPQWMTDQIRALSRAWLADKGLPEMGFTLGRIEELADDEVRCMVAVDDARRVHGVTSWLPVRRDGKVVGWTLDFMRRDHDGFHGVMEFLIASMAAVSRDEGLEFLSLSGAPLARLDRAERTPPLQRILDTVGRTLEPVYGFRSLLAFKAKFQPQYRPLFMSYPDAAALPSIGNAITRAYLPKITFDQGMRLVRTLVLRSRNRR
jgi:phosphatidylglycerol lysyltransferase